MYESKASLMGAFPMSPFDTDKHILEHGTTLRCFIFTHISSFFRVSTDVGALFYHVIKHFLHHKRRVGTYDVYIRFKA